MKSTFLALAGIGLFANAAMGAVSLENSGLAIAFYSYTGSGPSAVVGANTYVFDLGAASLYRENTGYNVSVSTVNSGIVSSNIGTDLQNTFGMNWANSGNVRWMVVGTANQSLGTVGGDTARTSYFSVARNDFNNTTSFFSSSAMSSALLTTASNKIAEFVNGTQGETSANNIDGTTIPIAATQSVDEFVNPTTNGLWFTVGTNITQTLGSGTIANGPNGLVFEGALDMYRVLSSTTGSDLSVGYSGGASELRKGQYIGTLALDSAGNLSIIPEPSSALLGVLGAAGVCFRRRRNS